MRKLFINVTLILIGFLCFYLQSNFFSWFTINGIRPNLFVIYILFIGLFGNKNMSIIYGSICGIILDLLFKQKIGANLVGLVMIGFIGTMFNKNFSKDSKITIIFMIFCATIIFETISYFLNYVMYSINVEIASFIKILIIETIYNVILSIILYPISQKFGYYIENEYKEDKILTRYF